MGLQDTFCGNRKLLPAWAATSSGRSGHRRAQQTFITSWPSPKVLSCKSSGSSAENKSTQKNERICYKEEREKNTKKERSGKREEGLVTDLLTLHCRTFRTSKPRLVS